MYMCRLLNCTIVYVMHVYTYIYIYMYTHFLLHIMPPKAWWPRRWPRACLGQGRAWSPEQAKKKKHVNDQIISLNDKGFKWKVVKGIVA